MSSRAGCKLGAPGGGAAALLAAALAAGCSPRPASPPADPAPASAPRAAAVRDPLVDSVERARGVQRTVDEAAARQRASIDGEEHDRAPP
jgi:hypothetical protein